MNRYWFDVCPCGCGELERFISRSSSSDGADKNEYVNIDELKTLIDSNISMDDLKKELRIN